jgi:hypothetical protein
MRPARLLGLVRMAGSTALLDSAIVSLASRAERMTGARQAHVRASR